MSRYKSKRSRALDFSIETKKLMLRRDGYRCIFINCKSSQNLTPAHFISRGAGGLGILENGACVCVSCHQKMDHTGNRKEMLQEFEAYLKLKHPDTDDEDRIYIKGYDYKP